MGGRALRLGPPDFQRPSSLLSFLFSIRASELRKDSSGSICTKGIHIPRLYILDLYKSQSSNDLTTITNLLIVAPISIPYNILQPLLHQVHHLESSTIHTISVFHVDISYDHICLREPKFCAQFRLHIQDQILSEIGRGRLVRRDLARGNTKLKLGVLRHTKYE